MDRLDVLDKKLRELERKQDFGKYPEYVTNTVNKALEKVIGMLNDRDKVFNRQIQKLSSDIKLLGKAINQAHAESGKALNSISKFKEILDLNTEMVGNRLESFDKTIKSNNDYLAEMVSANKQMRKNLITFFKDLPNKME